MLKCAIVVIYFHIKHVLMQIGINTPVLKKTP